MTGLCSVKYRKTCLPKSSIWMKKPAETCHNKYIWLRCLRNKSRPIRSGQHGPSHPHTPYFNVGFIGRRAVCKKRLFFRTPWHSKHKANIEIGGMGMAWLVLAISGRATFFSQTPVRQLVLLGVSKMQWLQKLLEYSTCAEFWQTLKNKCYQFCSA